MGRRGEKERLRVPEEKARKGHRGREKRWTSVTHHWGHRLSVPSSDLDP